MLGGNQEEMLGGNNFHPVSSHFYMHWKLTYPSILKNSNSSLRAGGHVGCWVEFHPASLSEEWKIDWFHETKNGKGDTAADTGVLKTAFASPPHHIPLSWNNPLEVCRPVCNKRILFTEYLYWYLVSNISVAINIITEAQFINTCVNCQQEVFQ